MLMIDIFPARIQPPATQNAGI